LVRAARVSPQDETCYPVSACATQIGPNRDFNQTRSTIYLALSRPRCGLRSVSTPHQARNLRRGSLGGHALRHEITDQAVVDHLLLCFAVQTDVVGNYLFSLMNRPMSIPGMAVSLAITMEVALALSDDLIDDPLGHQLVPSSIFATALPPELSALVWLLVTAAIATEVPETVP
jgi:hypothetical protein